MRNANGHELMSSSSNSTNLSALVLIDVLNDFLSEDGKVFPEIQSELERVNLIPNLIRLVAGAREAGLQIVYAPHGLHDHSFDEFPHVHPRLAAAVKNKVFWIGERGDDFFEPLQPQDGDIVAGHHRVFDAFIGTDLDEKLKEKGIERLVLAGLTTHTCVEGTGRHAIEAGYHVTFLTDAVAEFNRETHEAALKFSFPTFGFEALTVDEFVTRIKSNDRGE